MVGPFKPRPERSFWKLYSSKWNLGSFVFGQADWRNGHCKSRIYMKKSFYKRIPALWIMSSNNLKIFAKWFWGFENVWRENSKRMGRKFTNFDWGYTPQMIFLRISKNRRWLCEVLCSWLKWLIYEDWDFRAIYSRQFHTWSNQCVSKDQFCWGRHLFCACQHHSYFSSRLHQKPQN